MIRCRLLGHSLDERMWWEYVITGILGRLVPHAFHSENRIVRGLSPVSASEIELLEAVLAT